jgi:hypothetical protein
MMAGYKTPQVTYYFGFHHTAGMASAVLAFATLLEISQPPELNLHMQLLMVLTGSSKPQIFIFFLVLHCAVLIDQKVQGSPS